jgi:hypothetical protein
LLSLPSGSNKWIKHEIANVAFSPYSAFIGQEEGRNKKNPQAFPPACLTATGMPLTGGE